MCNLYGIARMNDIQNDIQMQNARFVQFQICMCSLCGMHACCAIQTTNTNPYATRGALGTAFVPPRGAVRARLIVETRSERLFESLDDAFGRIGLSAKQASNLTLANLRQILASRPTTSPRKRDGARARRSYRKSGRVLARKEGDDPKREYPATIVKVHDCGTVYDIKYDDGTTWKNAPAEVVRLR